MEITIDIKYKQIIIEAFEDYQYKIALELNEMKGQKLDKRRKELTRKQKLVEELRRKLNTV